MNNTLRTDLINAARFIADRKWIIGRGGNISVRQGEHIIIKASGCELATVTEADFVEVALATGEVVAGERAPSIELDTHLICYRTREDVQAVVHAHPSYATMLASCRQSLEDVTTDFALNFPGGVKRITYYRPGSPELSQNVAAAVGCSDGIMLANHGALTVGKSLKHACTLMAQLEEAAKITVLAAPLGGLQPLTRQQRDDLLTFYS